ncbi:MAG TPA: murein biosynthesis integral membrane protein MurJ [Candidatus Olsenella pullicola]|nr:murein biosynthesis integral membrane protein MurJ [Candidatus Olsenella pullicola]
MRLTPVSKRDAPSPARVSQESTQEQVGRSAALMSALVIVSRLTGFLRTWGQAYAIGVTVMASCYSVANNMPNQLYELVAAGMLTTAFLPVYMSVRKRAGIEGASAYTSNLVSLVLLVMGAVTVLGFVFAAELVYTQSFTATAEFDFDLAVYFFRFFVIEVVLYALSSIFSGVLNAERDYFWGQAAPIFNNFMTTASFFAYAFLADKNPELALLILALGNPLGVAVQVLLQVPPMLRHGIRLRFRIDLRDPLLRETLKIGVPSVAVMLMSVATTSVQSTASLSVVATGASVSYYARLWYTLPYSILTVPITTAMFTELSDSWAKGDGASFRAGITSGLGQILFFMLPFALYLIVFSVPLASVLAAGSFTPEALQMTAAYLAVYALSLPFYAVCMYLQKVASSMRRMGLYAWSSALATVLQIWILLAYTTTFGLNFVAFSSLLFFALIDVTMLVSLRRTLGPLGLSAMLASLVRTALLGAAGAAAGMLILRALNELVGDCSGAAVRSVLYCVLAGVPSLLVTYGGALLLKVPEAAMIGRLVSRLVRR